MAAENLRDELMALPGVAAAEVDESDESPSGVRVRLEPDADAGLVGAEVQRVLASHGMRSRIAGDDDRSAAPDEPELVPVEPVEPPPSVDLPDAVPPPPIEPPPMIPSPSLAAEPPAEVEEEAPAKVDSVAEQPETAAAVPVVGTGGSGLAAVAVEESAEGVSVRAISDDGRSVTRAAGPSGEGLFDAVVSAVGELAAGRAPGVVLVEPIAAADARVFTVVVERADGSLAAGAAVVRAESAYAVGRATWSAMSSI